VPVNYTLETNVNMNNNLFLTGDAGRRTISDLNFLLSQNIKVAMIYGDRDYRCNWLGAEAVSLNASYPSAPAFRAAGYANITTNSSYVGGVVRQHGGFSFSRVFESGHAVQAYQPETVYKIFNRAIFDKDVATGHHSIQNGYDVYSSEGLSSSFGIKNKLPAPRKSRCYFWAYNSTCTDNQAAALMNGTAVVKDLFVVEPSS
jgi:hypothetical protein